MLANRERAGLPAQGGVVSYKKPAAKDTATKTSMAAKTPYQEVEAMKEEIIQFKKSRKEVIKWLEKLVDYRCAREEQKEMEKEADDA